MKTGRVGFQKNVSSLSSFSFVGSMELGSQRFLEQHSRDFPAFCSAVSGLILPEDRHVSDRNESLDVLKPAKTSRMTVDHQAQTAEHLLNEAQPHHLLHHMAPKTYIPSAAAAEMKPH